VAGAAAFWKSFGRPLASEKPCPPHAKRQTSMALVALVVQYAFIEEDSACICKKTDRFHFVNYEHCI
jgi:hypothetical protein